jgi:F0F1-type ATP synthase delta subunit
VEPNPKLQLPNNLATKQDVVHIHRELGAFIEAVQASVMRHDKPIRYPAISDILQSVASANQIDLYDEAQSRQLLINLEQLQAKAPLLNISFASEPEPEALQKLMAWLRAKIDPQIIIQIGLQPTIAAGIIVHTSRRRFDLSLHRYLDDRRQELAKALKPEVT